MELTKEYLDKQFKLSKEYFDKQFKSIDERFDRAESEMLDMKMNIVSLQDGQRDMGSDIKDIKETLHRVDKRDLEDSNAFAKTLLSMSRRRRSS